MKPNAIATLLIMDNRTTTILHEDIVDSDTDHNLQARASCDQSCRRHSVLCFLVSQDEEHVRLELRVDASAVDLGERAHHQTLLLLARERRTDETKHIVSSEAGWRDVVSLVAMLGLDPQHINTHLSRAQRQLAPLLEACALKLSVVERRRGQVRFGAAAIDIVGW
jgi:hypothetical protein